MRLIDVTMPIYEGMALGRVFPQEVPFEVEDVFSYEKHGMRLCKLTMWQEPGTRLNTPALGNPSKITIDKIDLNEIVMRDTVILRIPKNAGEAVTKEEIINAFSKLDYHEGDAVIVHTGWGDNERYYELGDDYAIKSPYYSDEATAELAKIMTENNSNIFGYDTCSMGHPKKHIIPEWVNQNPRPKSWPSFEAKEYVLNYTPEKIMADWAGVLPLPRSGIMILGGLVNLGEIKKERVKLTVLPLKLRGLGGGPCRAIIIE